MQAHLQGIEVEPVRCGDHDLAVEHAAVGQTGPKRVVQLGKVAIERLEVAALDEDVVAAAKDDARESRPTWARRETRRRPGAPSASLASMGSIGGAIGNGGAS